jgi:hypothetical protein
MNRKVFLQISLIVVGIAQIFFGAAFTFAPEKFGAMMGLSAAPQWAYWMFSMFGARSFAFAYGMFLAARDPIKYIHWIQAMIGVQVIDWLGTLYYLANGGISFSQVSSASILPLIFIILLVVFYPRETNKSLIGSQGS